MVRVDGDVDPVTAVSPGSKKKLAWQLNCSASFFLSVLSVACWSLAGNACRLSLHAAFENVPFFSHTYAYFGPNCLGSFVMAVAVHAVPCADMPLLFHGLAAGFCGSFTTFSSWLIGITNAGSAANAFEELISGLSIPFVFYKLGHDTVRGVGELWICCTVEEPGNGEGGALRGGSAEGSGEPAEAAARSNSNSRSYISKVLSLMDYLIFALAVAATIAVPVGLQVSINRNRTHSISSNDIAAVCIAPIGAVTRYLLSVALNDHPRWHRLPVGTLVANVLGVTLAVVMAVYRDRRPDNSWLWIVAEGICGALSTVSSFVREVVTLRAAAEGLWVSYGYALLTMSSCVAIGIIGRKQNYV